MSESKHSPLPWSWDDTYKATDGGPTWTLMAATGYGVLSCDGLLNSPQHCNPHDAEFIVRACNSYYGMRKALQAASAALGPMENLLNPDLRALKAQIEENL